MPQGIPFTPNTNGMIPPISTRIVPRFSVKTFTFFISMVDIILMLATLIVAGVYTSPSGRTFRVFDINNAMGGPSAEILYLMGGQWCGPTTYFTSSIPTGAVWRLFTPIVLHAGLLHLFSNLLFQLHFGFTFEKRWTTPRFIAVYILTGLGGSLLSCVTGNPPSVGVGASGALFGLLGADMAYLIMNWNEIPMQKFEMFFLVIVVAMNFLFSMTGSNMPNASALPPPKIDNWAHFGGLMTGWFCAPILCPVITQEPKTRIYQAIAGFLWFALFLSLSLVIWVV